ncbi:hypothetical protein ACJX0J_028525, partial [Zea mays]
ILLILYLFIVFCLNLIRIRIQENTILHYLIGILTRDGDRDQMSSLPYGILGVFWYLYLRENRMPNSILKYASVSKEILGREGYHNSEFMTFLTQHEDKKQDEILDDNCLATQKKTGGLKKPITLLVHEQLNCAVIHLIVTRNSSTCFPAEGTNDT